MTILETFRIIAPEFSDVSDSDVQAYIELTTPLVSAKLFDNLYNQALAYYTAHRMCLANAAANSGGGMSADITANGLVSEKEGDLARSYGYMSVASSSDGNLEKTLYGQEYKRLLRLRVIPARTRLG